MGIFIKNKRLRKKLIDSLQAWSWIASCVRFIYISHILDNTEKNYQHIEGGTRESDPHVKDLQYQRLGKPRRRLQIFDTRMGIPRPTCNVLLDNLTLRCLTLRDGETWTAI